MTAPWMSDVRLVAEREVRERLRSKSFRVMTMVSLLAVSGLIVLSAARGSKQPTFRVGLVNTPTAGIADGLSFAAHLGTARAIPVAVADEAAARGLIASKKITLAVIDGNRILVRNPIEKGDAGHRARFVGALAQRLGVESSLRQAGLPPDRVQEAVGSHPAAVQALRAPAVSESRRVVAMGGVVLLFLFLQQYGSWILLGVVEEKSTRVIEVLLSTVRPRRLLSGKILGIGLVAGIQATIVAVGALVASSAVGNHALVAAAPVTILPAAVWCMIGYAFYCSLYATFGSMATRTEDAQNTAFPVGLGMFVAYLVAFAGLGGGDPSPVLRVLAYLPPTAPFCMPVLALVHGATWWQEGLVAAVTLLCAAYLMRLAGRVYVASINRTRSRTRFRDLRSVLAA